MEAKKILVPIDFHVASLNTLKLALESEATARIAAVLMYPETLSGSISELLFYNPLAQIRKLMGKEFKEALSILQSRHESRLAPPHVQLYHGKSRSAMLHFLMANGIEEIYVPKAYRLRLGPSLDPIRVLRECGLPVHEMDWKDSLRNSEMEDLTSFFTSSIEYEQE